MKTRDQKIFQRYLIISSLLHVVFISIFIFGIPSFSKPLIEPEVMVFEMISADDILNIKDQTTKKSDEPEILESQRVKKTQEEPAVEETKKEEPQKEEPKAPSKEPEIIPEKTEKKKEIIVPKKEPEKTKPKKPKEPKKPVKKQEDVMDDILKKLEKESHGQALKSPNRNTGSKADEGKFTKGNNFDEESPLSVTEKLLIKKQVESQWQPPVGTTNVENVQVILHLKVLEDGTVTEVKIKEVLCPTGSGQTCDLVADSAARAAKKASPLQNLRPQRYDTWKEFDLRFDPSSIMK